MQRPRSPSEYCQSLQDQHSQHIYAPKVHKRQRVGDDTDSAPNNYCDKLRENICCMGNATNGNVGNSRMAIETSLRNVQETMLEIVEAEFKGENVLKRQEPCLFLSKVDDKCRFIDLVLQCRNPCRRIRFQALNCLRHLPSSIFRQHWAVLDIAAGTLESAKTSEKSSDLSDGCRNSPSSEVSQFCLSSVKQTEDPFLKGSLVNILGYCQLDQHAIVASLAHDVKRSIAQRLIDARSSSLHGQETLDTDSLSSVLSNWASCSLGAQKVNGLGRLDPSRAGQRKDLLDGPHHGWCLTSHDAEEDRAVIKNMCSISPTQMFDLSCVADKLIRSEFLSDNTIAAFYRLILFGNQTNLVQGLEHLQRSKQNKIFGNLHGSTPKSTGVSYRLIPLPPKGLFATFDVILGQIPNHLTSAVSFRIQIQSSNGLQWTSAPQKVDMIKPPATPSGRRLHFRTKAFHVNRRVLEGWPAITLNAELQVHCGTLFQNRPDLARTNRWIDLCHLCMTYM